MKSVIFSLLLFLHLVLNFLLFPLQGQAQSGWVREKGSIFLKNDAFFFQSTRYLNLQGDELRTARFSQYMIQLYGEYGLGKRFALQVYAPLIRWNQFETTDPAIGQGDLKLELKYALLRGKTPVSFAIAPEFPTGRAQALAANRSIPGDGIFLPTGDGEFNVWSTLAASRSFGTWYLSLYAAYNFRTQYQGLAFRDLYQAGGELGFHPIDPLWLQLKSRIQGSIGESQHPELGFVRGDATTYTAMSLGIWYELNQTWGLSLESGIATPWILGLRNIYAAPYYSAGVSWKLE